MKVIQGQSFQCGPRYTNLAYIGEGKTFRPAYVQRARRRRLARRRQCQNGQRMLLLLPNGMKVRPLEDGLDVFFYRLFINQAITHILGPFQAITFSTIVLGIKLVVPSNACHNKHITILNHQQMNDMNVNKFSLLLMFHRVNTKLRGNRIKSFFTQIRTCWA